MKLSHDELKGLMKNKLMQAGLKADHADMTADVLTWSDERGYHSHGAVRVEYYSERIAKGGITVDPKFEWRETGPLPTPRPDVNNADRRRGNRGRDAR